MDFAGLQDPMCGNPLPVGWKLMRLGDFGTVRYGLGQPPEQSADGVPMVRATNVKRGRLVSDGLIRIKREAIPESRNPYLCAGEIIVVRSGAYTGDVAMVTHDWAGSVVGYDLVFSSKEQVDPAFCAAVLLSEPIQSFFRGERDRSAQPHLNRQQLESTAIPVPPVDEQGKIAVVLGLVRRAIQQQERLIALTTELKKALLHKLFTEGLRGEPQKQTEIGPVPESWATLPLEKIVLQKIVDGVHETPKYIDTGVPFITAKDIIGNRICFDECRYISVQEHKQLTRRIKPQRGDMFLTKVGTVGNVGIVDFDEEFSFFVQLALIRPNPDQIVPDYLYWALQCGAVQSEISSAAPQSTMKFIGTQKIAKVPLPIPPLAEQPRLRVHSTSFAPRFTLRNVNFRR
jgi:type I restriction enzyme S subunit